MVNDRLDTKVKWNLQLQRKTGWALHKPRGGQTRFSQKVRAYLQKKFEIGLGRGRKEEPSQVANDTRKARNADVTRMFGRTEWLSKLQI